MTFDPAPNADADASPVKGRLKRASVGVVIIVCTALGVIALGVFALDRAVDNALRGGPPPDPTKLAGLKALSISTYTPPGGRLVHDFASDEQTSLGKRSPALIRRVFTFDGPGDARAGRKAAVETAEAAGWEMGRLHVSDDGDSIWGKKQLSTGEATLAISNATRDGRFQATISIEHDPCSVLLCADG